MAGNEMEAHMKAETSDGALCKNRDAYIIDQHYTLDFDVNDTPIMFWDVGVTCNDCINKVLRLKNIDPVEYNAGDETRSERYKAARITAGTWSRNRS